MQRIPNNKETAVMDGHAENNRTVIPSLFKSSNQVIFLVTVAFIAGTLLLMTIESISSSSMERLIRGNNRELQELRMNNQLREAESDLNWVESRIRAAVATGDTSHLEGVGYKTAQIKIALDSIRQSDRRSTSQAALLTLELIAQHKLWDCGALLARYKATGKMNDTALVANPGARKSAAAISDLVRSIYQPRESMMVELNADIQENSQSAKFYGNILIALILITGGGLCWYIILKMKTQNQLILQLGTSEKSAREAALIKESFMANMSHEIRTPLNAILGFTSILEKWKLDGDAGQFVLAIQRAGENLLTIVDDILDLSKIEAGMLRIVHTPFCISELLHSIQTLFDERVRSKGLRLTTSVDPELPSRLIGDATRLTQILVNLIGNSLKFTEKGSIAVSVYAGDSHENTIDAAFFIEDTGIGIEKDKLATIFERFKQAEDSTSRHYGGTGLGLSIVRDLISLQNGTVDVESTAGKGTVFRFVIPYVIATDNHETKQAVISPAIDQADHRNFRILVVDDNEMNRNLMNYLLNQWMYAFDIVADGREALELLSTRSYNLVLMDIQMPEMDGYAVTAAIRSQLRLHVPVVAMTAHALAGEREKCMSNGMDEYISKPINELGLLKLINLFATTQTDKECNQNHS